MTSGPSQLAWLLAATLALGLAPVTDRLIRGARARAALSGALEGMLGVLVGLHVLPEAVETAGLWACVWGLIGFVLPNLLERGRAFGAWVTVVGLGVHAAVDGAALSTVTVSLDALALGGAVVLHRLPFGLFVWGVAKRRRGVPAAVAALVGLGVATALGVALGGAVDLETPVLACFQALVSGTLLHVLIEASPFDADDGDGALAPFEATGLLFGAAAALGVSTVGLGHDASEHAFRGEAIFEVAMVAPALLLGLALAAGARAWGRPAREGALLLLVVLVAGSLGWWAALVVGIGRVGLELVAGADAADPKVEWTPGVLLGAPVVGALLAAGLPEHLGGSGWSWLVASVALGALSSLPALAWVLPAAAAVAAGVPSGPAIALLLAARPGSPGWKTRGIGAALAFGTGALLLLAGPDAEPVAVPPRPLALGAALLVAAFVLVLLFKEGPRAWLRAVIVRGHA